MLNVIDNIRALKLQEKDPDALSFGSKIIDKANKLYYGNGSLPA
jgi:hypothetical protein